jgi:hypothetical protein
VTTIGKFRMFWSILLEKNRNLIAKISRTEFGVTSLEKSPTKEINGSHKIYWYIHQESLQLPITMMTGNHKANGYIHAEKQCFHQSRARKLIGDLSRLWFIQNRTLLLKLEPTTIGSHRECGNMEIDHKVMMVGNHKKFGSIPRDKNLAIWMSLDRMAYGDWRLVLCRTKMEIGNRTSFGFTVRETLHHTTIGNHRVYGHTLLVPTKRIGLQ